jgi:threonine dehydratase
MSSGPDDTEELDLSAVQRAAQRLRNVAIVTPVLSGTRLDELTNGQVLVKCENLQRGGAFKFRGAYNALSTLSKEQRAAGVVAVSSGNHGVAVSLAGRLFETSVTVICPENAAKEKLAIIRASGARLLSYDPATQNREEASAQIVGNGATLIPAFDYLPVMAGQGTIALELLAQVGHLDAVVVPVGGGGLISGIAVAIKALAPWIDVIGVEPEIADDTRRSMSANRIVQIDYPSTIADGLRSTSPGLLTFPVVNRLVDEVVTVSEEQIIGAMAALFDRAHVVAEPSGAVAVAAVLSGAVNSTKRHVAVVISGGNIDSNRFADLVSSSSSNHDEAHEDTVKNNA